MTEGKRLTPQEALDRLLEGNRRFQHGEGANYNVPDQELRQRLAEKQSPFAAVVTCADARTPPERIFDVGFGELFVCRNGGNLIGEIALGSLEYAVHYLGASLVAVMGHTSCGAVTAAVEAAKDPDLFTSHNIDDIVRRLLPSVIAAAGKHDDEKEWVNAAAHRNVIDTCKKIIRQSPIIKGQVDEGHIQVVGLWYDLFSGKVDIIWLD